MISTGYRSVVPVLGWVLWALPTAASAQPGPQTPSAGRVAEALEERRAAFVPLPSLDADQALRIRGAIRSSGRTLVPLGDEGIRVRLEEGDIAREDVAALSQVEQLMEDARESRLALQDRRALHQLARAKHVLLELAGLPGAARWLSEVETMHGVMMAQSGNMRLAAQALRRALVLDRARLVRLGEASPEVVRLSAQLQRELSDAATGQIAVRVVGDIAAQVYLDDRLVGESPVRVTAKTGRHLLRVEARGHVAYGVAVDLAVGEQLPALIRLTEQPELRRSRTLRSHLIALDLFQVPDLLVEMGLDEAWWATASSDGDRTLVGRCSRTGCGIPLRLPGRASGALLRLLPDERADQLLADANLLEEGRMLDPALAWLQDSGRPSERVDSEPEPWLWLGVGAGIAIAGGILAIVLVNSASEDDPTLQVQVDPCPVLNGCR